MPEEADRLHAPAAAGAEIGELLFTVSGGCGGSDSEQLAAQREFVVAAAVGKKTVMADAVEPVWQSMQQEAADELVGRQGHHLALIVMPVIAPTEADLPVGV
jgi:hypothetical protein